MTNTAAPRPEETLSRVSVAKPCSASWDEMLGGDRVRSCEHCRKKVYNLSAMTAEEAVALVRQAEGGRQVCVRFYRRADGTMLTQDCPVGLARVRRRVARAAAAVFGSVLVGATGFTRLFRGREETPPQPIMGAPVAMPAPVTAPAPTVTMGEPAIMGDIAVAPPQTVEPAPLMGKVALRPEQGRVAVRSPRRVDLPMAAPQVTHDSSITGRDPVAPLPGR
jgi:hypothetical protein